MKKKNPWQWVKTVHISCWYQHKTEWTIYAETNSLRFNLDILSNSQKHIYKQKNAFIPWNHTAALVCYILRTIRIEIKNVDAFIKCCAVMIKSKVIFKRNITFQIFQMISPLNKESRSNDNWKSTDNDHFVYLCSNEKTKMQSISILLSLAISNEANITATLE